MIERPRVVPDLTTLQGTRLLLIKALAGYGKTTLLHQCQDILTAGGNKVAWLRLEQADNEKIRLVSYIAAAFGEVVPEVSIDLGPLLTAIPPHPIEDVIGALIDRLESVGDRIFLFIDDYNLVEQDELHQVFRYFLVNMPRNVHCVIASRSTPPWNTADIAGNGAVKCIDERELRFTESEVADFLRAELDTAFDAAELEAFCRRTDGWITAIRLAAMSMSGGRATLPDLPFIMGTRAGLVEYLAASVFEKLDKETRDFLLQTAPLERLCASLCDAVTGANNAARMLDRLCERNLFIEPLDAKGDWFQYHTLFSEFLVNRLDRDSEVNRADIHRRASHWLEINRQPYAAAEHALAAGDPARKESLIEAAILSLVRASQISLAIGWFESTPASFSADKPNVLIPMAWSYISACRFEKASEMLDRGHILLSERQESLSEGDLKNRAQFLTEIELARLEIARIVDGVVPDRRRLLEIKQMLQPGWNFLRAFVELQFCYAYVREDKLEAAFAAASDTVLHARKIPNLFITNVGLAQLANIRQLQGRNAEAMQFCNEAISAALDEAGSPLPIAGQFHLIAAGIHYEANDLKRSRASLDLTLQLAALKVSPDLFSEAEILAAMYIGATQGDEAAVARLLRHNINGLSESTPQKISRVRAYLAWFLVGCKDLVAAEGVLRQSEAPIDRSGPSQTLVVNPLIEIHYLALARYLIAAGKAPEAGNWLRHLLRAAQSNGRLRSVACINGLLALCYAARGQADSSMRSVREMLQLGEQGGFARSIVDLGPEITVLIDDYRKKLLESPHAEVPLRLRYVDHLLAIARDADVRIELGNARHRALHAAASAADGNHERLTPRELEILELISMGKKNRDVAIELLIAESSVRWHVRNLFSKLEVSNRTEASVRARALKLIN